MNPILYIVIAITFVLLLAAILSVLARPEQNPVQARLKQWTDWDTHQPQDNEIPRSRNVRRRGLFSSDSNTILFPGLQRMLVQVKSPFSVTTFFLLVLVVMVVSGGFVWLTSKDVLRSVIFAVICGSVPFIVLRFQKQRYIKQFEGQLPQALDMLARSLWAGHTIQTGIRIIGQDFDDPVRSEFSKTAEAIDFGMPLPVALEALAQRVDIADLRFFVTSVLVQRETGGNLADILARTATLIRERLEFNDRIKALSAQGRFSANILFVLPLMIAGAIYLINPGHFDVLFESEIGFISVIVSGTMMVVGMLIVRRIVKINV